MRRGETVPRRRHLGERGDAFRCDRGADSSFGGAHDVLAGVNRPALGGQQRRIPGGITG